MPKSCQRHFLDFSQLCFYHVSYEVIYKFDSDMNLINHFVHHQMFILFFILFYKHILIEINEKKYKFIDFYSTLCTINVNICWVWFVTLFSHKHNPTDVSGIMSGSQSQDKPECKIDSSLWYLDLVTRCNTR